MAATAASMPILVFLLALSPQPVRSFLFIVLATFISEDLTTIHIGVLASQGRIGFLGGTLACFTGIFVGDVLLYLAGRTLGRVVLGRAPLNWFLREDSVAAGSRWIEKRGALVIAISRFVPGTRLPTYFAAGMLRTSFWKFTLYFLLASAVWTPLLVWLTAWYGEHVVQSLLQARTAAILPTVLSALVFWGLLKLAMKAATSEGRRLLKGQFLKWRRWEFWPPYLFYPPVLAWIGWLALKNRSLTVFTAANPAIEAGGFIGESKSAILDGLKGAGENIARYLLIRADMSNLERMSRALEFIRENGLSLPVILKPDAGQRGAGVRIVKSEDDLREALSSLRVDSIVQEYIPGLEFGVFYYRQPGKPHGHIFSITEKIFPEVCGDGIRNLRQLILDDERAVALAGVYLDRQRSRLEEIVPAGESVRLVEIGSHCRGAIFLDGEARRTPELEAAIDRISRCFDGFHFGRYDIRVDSIDSLMSGQNLRVIELNGVTSEATSIYDPRNSVFQAWRVLCRQWSLAFEIGVDNSRRGERVSSVRDLVRLALGLAG